MGPGRGAPDSTGDQVGRYGTSMADPWNFAGPITQLDSTVGAVTLVDESTFAISGGAGDISPGAAQGLFVRDTRILSRFEVLVDGLRTEPLAAVTDDPFSATFVSRCIPAPGRADSTLMVFRSRYVGQGMREDLTIRNFADESAVCTVQVFIGSDFADLFAVKEGRVGTEPGAGELSTAVHVAPPRRCPVRSRRPPAVGRAVDGDLVVPTGVVVRGVEIRFLGRPC